MSRRQRGTGRIFLPKGSSVWWLQYYQNGVKRRESAETSNRKEALEKLKFRIAELTTGSVTGLTPKKTEFRNWRKTSFATTKSTEGPHSFRLLSCSFLQWLLDFQRLLDLRCWLCPFARGLLHLALGAEAAQFVGAGDCVEGCEFQVVGCEPEPEAGRCAIARWGIVRQAIAGGGVTYG
jgi:hypothetical protein